MPITDNEKVRFIKFAIVGISGTVVDFAIFNLLIFLNFPSLLASSISFITAVFNNFFWNRHWTYPESKVHSTSSQFIKFSIVSAAGLLFRSFIYDRIEKPSIDLAVRLLKGSFFITPEVAGKNLSLGAVIIIILFWNYFANRLWTYKEITDGNHTQTEN